VLGGRTVGVTWQSSRCEAHGRSSGDEPEHHRGGEDPGEEKTQEGLDSRRALTTPARSTDSQGEQRREVGQRHLLHS
jgi:hypothetical protein